MGKILLRWKFWGIGGMDYFDKALAWNPTVGAPQQNPFLVDTAFPPVVEIFAGMWQNVPRAPQMGHETGSYALCKLALSKTNISKKHTSAHMDPETATSAPCEPVQSKCAWTTPWSIIGTDSHRRNPPEVHTHTHTVSRFGEWIYIHVIAAYAGGVGTSWSHFYHVVSVSLGDPWF